uniref:Uncharacterized protein n=1 Tax=Arundo donax TaxID=35708 RepID=A0A0A9DI85_ARUDO
MVITGKSPAYVMILSWTIMTSLIAWTTPSLANMASVEIWTTTPAERSSQRQLFCSSLEGRWRMVFFFPFGNKLQNFCRKS